MADLFHILAKEVDNWNFIRLYKEDNIWVAYEYSAFLLDRILHNTCSSNFINPLYEVIVATVQIRSDECLGILLKGYPPLLMEVDYIEIDASALNAPVGEFDLWKNKLPVFINSDIK